MRKIKAVLIAFLLISLVCAGATTIRPASSQFQAREIPPIVSPKWLESHLNLAEIVILDIRSSDQYIAGHIPGAINVPDFNWYVNPPFGNETPWMEMPPADQLFETIGNAGITQDSYVVIVGSTGGLLSPVPLALYGTAGVTRVAMALLYAGLTNVAILDGGYEKWVAEGRATSTVPTTPTPVTYSGTVKSEMLVSKDYILDRLGKAIIVDARDSVVYLGLVQEPWTERKGHIPKARSLPTPWLWNITLSGENAEYVTYKSYDELSTLAQSTVGADVTKEIIVYCGVGGYASTMHFVLSEVLGYENVKVYDGSAQEWSSDPTLPMNSPPARTLPAIVSTTWLYYNLDMPNLVILDIRSHEAYNAGHIPGAINVPDFNWYVNPPFGNETPWMEMPPADQLFETIGNAGITNSSFVVVVGSTSGPLSPIPLALYNTATATRVAMALLYAGLENVAVLDGGYEKWFAEGKPISTDPVTPTAQEYYGSVKSNMIVSQNYVIDSIGKAVIVDARDLVVYLGFVQEPWTPRVGHIPTAVNLPTPWLWNLQPNATDGSVIYATYKDIDMLGTMTSAVVGANTSQEVIVYCGVGGYASTMHFVLSEVLGYENVKVYDGSAQEWTSNASLPVIYEELGSEYMELSSRLNELENSLDELNATLNDLMNEYDALQESYSELLGNHSTLQSNYNALQESYSELEGEFNELSNSLDELNATLNDLMSEYEELEKAYNELAASTMPAYLTYTLLATTVIFLIATIYLALKVRT